MARVKNLSQALGRAHLHMLATWFFICAIAAGITAVLRLPGGWTAWGISATVGLILVGITVGVHRLVVVRPSLTMAWMGMDFLGKIVVILITLGICRKTNIAEPYTMFFMLLALILGLSLLMSLSLVRARVPLLDSPAP